MDIQENELQSNRTIYRGDIYYADLNPIIGSEQGGIRPVVIIQNNIGNRYSPTIIVAATTGKTHKYPLPTHTQIDSNSSVFKQDTIILLEQIRTIDLSRLRAYIGHLNYAAMRSLDDALAISIGL